MIHKCPNMSYKLSLCTCICGFVFGGLIVYRESVCVCMCVYKRTSVRSSVDVVIGSAPLV